MGAKTLKYSKILQSDSSKRNNKNKQKEKVVPFNKPCDLDLNHLCNFRAFSHGYRFAFAKFDIFIVTFNYKPHFLESFNAEMIAPQCLVKTQITL